VFITIFNFLLLFTIFVVLAWFTGLFISVLVRAKVILLLTY